MGALAIGDLQGVGRLLLLLLQVVQHLCLLAGCRCPACWSGPVHAQACVVQQAARDGHSGSLGRSWQLCCRAVGYAQAATPACDTCCGFPASCCAAACVLSSCRHSCEHELPTPALGARHTCCMCHTCECYCCSSSCCRWMAGALCCSSNKALCWWCLRACFPAAMVSSVAGGPPAWCRALQGAPCVDGCVLLEHIVLLRVRPHLAISRADGNDSRLLLPSALLSEYCCVAGAWCLSMCAPASVGVGMARPVRTGFAAATLRMAWCRALQGVATSWFLHAGRK